MNRNRLLLIGFIALAMGAFVSLVVYRNLQSRTASKAPPGEEVVVAAEDSDRIAHCLGECRKFVGRLKRRIHQHQPSP